LAFECVPTDVGILKLTSAHKKRSRANLEQGVAGSNPAVPTSNSAELSEVAGATEAKFDAELRTPPLFGRVRTVQL